MINKSKLKDYYQRFKDWQAQPFEFKIASDEVHRCKNCGHEFVGNFCPVCSQKAGMGRINWYSVRQGVMDIWGLGTRSLLYSLWQLLLRPGHIIGDYIDGKRQVSFPPVKMLFIVAVLYSMVAYWFLPDVLHIHAADKTGVAAIDQSMKELADFNEWSQKYYSWYALFMAVLAVLPTWLLFRYSPRRARHTLPEGFFIQIFLAVIMMALSFILLLLGFFSPLVYILFTMVLYGVYYIIVYYYLFGYSLWGTLWRCGFILVTVLLLSVAGGISLFGMDMTNYSMTKAGVKNAYAPSIEDIIFSYLFLALFLFGIGFLINLVVTRKARRELKQAASR